ncbi:MAG: ABC transporter permease [Verrucomicrobia bacterium]|nr:ABC transporter permease [Verrucomicrobiota bacterium]MCG2679839.1 ABC transporter permease [Kiritimatiellia bacterium]MBU4248487.1 ABC transporter permease [Verrucomicrobiota bacterium]MBU4290376.1 ABC transporter permease [Verrucomicrobiota bacterium]MBU4429764.1 ABC transporter permease [Verrucomicrobiota bacterium]
MRFLIPCLAGLVAVSVWAEARPWATPEDETRVFAELQAFLQGAENRFPGTAGNLAMEDNIARQFEATGLEHGEIRFQTPCFIPGDTALIVAGREPVRLYPLHPTLFRPGNFREKDFSARMVYLGRGTAGDLDRMKGIPLENALVVMEFDSGAAWTRFLRFGVKGFVFIEPDTYERLDAYTKVYDSEVAVPRFFVEARAGRALKEAAASAPQVRVRAEPSRWENRWLRDLWVLIPGSDASLADEVCVIVAPIDSNCIVPEKASGAQGGANLYLLTQLVEQFQETPPRRSMLLAAVNAHTQNYLGERLLAWHLLSDGVERVRDTLSVDRREARLIAEYYQRLNLDTFRLADEETLIAWRSLIDDSTGRNLTVKDPLVAMAKRDVNRLKTEQLRLIDMNLSKADFERRRLELEALRTRFVKVLTLFNKVGVKTRLSELAPAERDILKGYIREVIAFQQIKADLNERDLNVDKQNGAVREALNGRKVPFVIALALDWNGHRLGFSSLMNDSKRWGIRWGVNVDRIAAAMDGVAKEGKPDLLEDTISLRGGLFEQYYISGGSAGIQCFQRAANTPAFGLHHVFSGGGLVFLPSDTLDRLDRVSLATTVLYVPALLRAILDDPNVTASSELSPVNPMWNENPLWSVQVRTFKFDELAASVVPDIPVAESAVILNGVNSNPDGVPVGKFAIQEDVVSACLALTDQRATAILYGLTYMRNNSQIISGAFHFDPDFVNVDHAIDAGDVFLKSMAGAYQDKVTLALFECREFPLYTTTDSSLVAALPIRIGSMIPLTARGNSSPRRFGGSGMSCTLSKKGFNPSCEAPAAFYFPSWERVKFVTGSKRTALNATDKMPEGRGFADATELGYDLFAVIVRDMSILNQARAKKLRDVASELVHEFLQRGNRCLERMQMARAQNDYTAYLRALYEGLGAQVKSYAQAKQTTDDMLKAVVVYMALLLPFCFFLQKLLFKFVRIEQEMAMFAVLFVITFIIFRLIHPAFRVSQAAEVIFLAFVMGALGLFVISILRSRFEGEMQLMFRSFLGSDTGDVGYSTVTQKAMLIGVNNMKRRRIRTMLTTATIVLIAFAMLSFTSISKKVNPTIIAKSRDIPYTGFMYHWPGRSTMDEATLAVMRDLFDPCGQVVVRRWLLAEESIPFHVTAGMGTAARFEAVMGFAQAENGFLTEMPLIAGRYFSADNADEVLLSAGAAGVLNLDPQKLDNVTLAFKGRSLKVVGVYDDARFRAIKDINGIPLLPIQRIIQETGRDNQSTATAAQQQAEDISAMGVLVYVDPMSLLVVPLETSLKMGARPYSISVKLKESESVWTLMDILLTATSAKFYLSSRIPFAMGGKDEKPIAAGVYYVGSNYSTSVGGLAVLLIPLLIASTIILNTMLGSVYERKREIAVYNAIGLNPHHIGMFFLAESFVYGVIGAVGGYLIGQVLSLALSQTGWMKGINFNYSSLSVAYVILFTIAIVLLSTIYPAVVATKAAVPSGKRTWSLPPHDGHTMQVVFPFIYHPRIAAGVLAYLQDYFSRFTAASIGDLIATAEGQGVSPDEKGRPRYRWEYHVALAPYDLGVTQRLVFELGYDDYIQAFRLKLNITRVSGQDTNWVTTNRPFLERLRKYLMRWRNIDAAQQKLFVQQAQETFGKG